MTGFVFIRKAELVNAVLAVILTHHWEQNKPNKISLSWLLDPQAISIPHFIGLAEAEGIDAPATLARAIEISKKLIGTSDSLKVQWGDLKVPRLPCWPSDYDKLLSIIGPAILEEYLKT